MFLICLLVISLKTPTFELIALQTIICSFFFLVKHFVSFVLAYYSFLSLNAEGAVLDAAAVSIFCIYAYNFCVYIYTYSFVYIHTCICSFLYMYIFL